MIGMSLVLASIISLSTGPTAHDSGAVWVDSSHALMHVIALTTDSTHHLQSDRLFESMQQLRRVEDQYFTMHGSYTADPGALPKYHAPTGTKISITAGRTWLVLQGEAPNVSIQQLTMWRKGFAEPSSSVFRGDEPAGSTPTR